MRSVVSDRSRKEGCFLESSWSGLHVPASLAHHPGWRPLHWLLLGCPQQKGLWKQEEKEQYRVRKEETLLNQKSKNKVLQHNANGSPRCTECQCCSRYAVMCLRASPLAASWLLEAQGLLHTTPLIFFPTCSLRSTSIFIHNCAHSQHEFEIIANVLLALSHSLLVHQEQGVLCSHTFLRMITRCLHSLHNLQRLEE